KNQYIYQYKDHLGNVRISFGRTSAGALEITDANDYYPFGMNHLKTGNAFFGQGNYKNYKYNGKELQETGMYDYGARFYMPDIGRWGVVDPLAETSRRWSTYTYAYNNPIRFIDPDGREGTDWVHNRETNQVYWNNDATSQATAGENETYLGKSGTFTAYDGTTTYLGPNGSNDYKNNSLLGATGSLTNLDPLIKAGDFAPGMSIAAFGNNDGSYIRATPDNPFANPSSQLAYNGLIGMQMAASGIAVEAALGAVGITGGLSLSTTGSVAGDGLGGLGVQVVNPTNSGFAGVVNNSRALWGTTQQQMSSHLGEGWTSGSYGSNGMGWKLTNGDKSVFYNQSSSAHGGAEYWGFSSAELGKTKIINPSTYLPRIGDKATILPH
ncbi:RHS repeat-associated core domain-containing protein, partial [Chryseobacterium ureilyticum]